MSGPLAGPNAMRFSSMPYYERAGIVGYAFRFYDPILQRWLNQDPIGEAGGINLYGFVGNNPISNVDPYGLAFGDWWDPRTYGLGGSSGAQTLPNGDLYMPPAPLPDPNTFGALHGIDLSITGGQPPGDFIADRAMDVAKDSVLAMSMFAGLGEEEEGAEAAGGLWKWFKGLASKCKKKPTGLPKIFGSRGGTMAAEKVAELKNAMLGGKYRFTDPEGQIGGWINSKGEYMIGEGHHRMQAALDAAKESGDMSYVQQLLQNGRWTRVNQFPTPSIPLPPVR
jgi:RHS repeat-associated protein